MSMNEDDLLRLAKDWLAEVIDGSGLKPVAQVCVLLGMAAAQQSMGLRDAGCLTETQATAHGDELYLRLRDLCEQDELEVRQRHSEKN